jgi:hypothetical protein
MAQVVKCDQCGKVDVPSNMQYMVIQLRRDNLRGVDYNSNYMADGDFCSEECIKIFIDIQLTDIWYKARNNY